MSDTNTPPVVAPVLKAGNAQVQQDAEAEILQAVARVSGGPALSPAKVVLAEGVSVPVDGVDQGRSVFVEAFARQGALKGGQRKKSAQDILKLSLIKEHYPRARLIIAFASPEARASVRGWLARAASVHGIE